MFLNRSMSIISIASNEPSRRDCASPPAKRSSSRKRFGKRRQMIGARQFMQALLHPLAIADVARDAQNSLRFLAGGILHPLQRRLQPDVVLIRVARAVHDRCQRLALRGSQDGGANGAEVVRMHEFAQRAAKQISRRDAEDAARNGRSVDDRPVGCVLGDQVGRILGDQLVLLHRFDQGVFPITQAGGQAVERAAQRANLAAAGAAGQRSDSLGVRRVVLQVSRSGPPAGASGNASESRSTARPRHEASSSNWRKCQVSSRIARNASSFG